MILSQLRDVTWDAMESLDYDDIDLAEDPFKPITTLLDSSFQHKEEIELPERCQEIFHKKTSKHT